ncbi:MAG: FHA domain-containing protein [Bacteroidales bacterium]|nr:FHA domain-containing protein [Bacteroidales bacterium]
MEIEIKIGREESGANAINVPNTCKKAGRHHASLQWKDGKATLIDNESANGTFVNGQRIAKKGVKETDTVWLGGIGDDVCYQLDLKKIFDSCRKAEEGQRTDYSKEFEDIKRAYMDYKAEETRIKNSQNVKMRIVNFIPMIAGGLFALIPLGFMRMIGLAIGVVVTLVLLSQSSKHDIQEEITELQIKYQPRYCCPKCGMKFPFTTHWKKLEADGKCPNPKCNAEFVK